MRGAAGDRSGRWNYWRGWDWTSLRLKVAEVGDAGFPEVAVVGHNLGVVRRSL